MAFLKTHQREKGIPNIFIDILKAFDIAANILLKKLKIFGVNQWQEPSQFGSYLNNRKQCILINHELETETQNNH